MLSSGDNAVSQVSVILAQYHKYQHQNPLVIFHPSPGFKKPGCYVR